MGRIIIDVPQGVQEHLTLDAGEAEILLNEIDLLRAARSNPIDKSKLAEETRKISGMWNGRFKNSDEMIEYFSKLRRTGGHPDRC